MEDKTFKKIMHNAVLSNPTEDFTDSIMHQIAARKQVAARPVISKKAWRIVAGLAVVIFTAIILTPKTGAAPSKYNGLFKLNNQVFVQQSSLVLACLISVCVLLVIDSALRKKANVAGAV